jgi:hypothetical protein
MDTWTDQTPDVVVGFADFRWRLYCTRCKNTQHTNLEIGDAHTMDGPRLTSMANAVLRHERQVHGGE